MVFLCLIGPGQLEPIALILPMDIPAGSRSRKDTHLGLYRVHSRSRSECIFVSARNIVRGALLANAYDQPGHYFAVDMIDSDMFLRLKEIFL